MMFKRGSEEEWDQRPRLAERKIDRGRSGLYAVEQLGNTREGRGDKIVEISERGPNSSYWRVTVQPGSPQWLPEAKEN